MAFWHLLETKNIEASTAINGSQKTYTILIRGQKSKPHHRIYQSGLSINASL